MLLSLDVVQFLKPYRVCVSAAGHTMCDRYTVHTYRERERDVWPCGREKIEIDFVKKNWIEWVRASVGWDSSGSWKRPINSSSFRFVGCSRVCVCVCVSCAPHFCWDWRRRFATFNALLFDTFAELSCISISIDNNNSNIRKDNNEESKYKIVIILISCHADALCFVYALLPAQLHGHTLLRTCEFRSGRFRSICARLLDTTIAFNSVSLCPSSWGVVN